MIALCGALLAVDTEEDDAGIPTPWNKRSAKRLDRPVCRAPIKNSSSVVSSRSSFYRSFVICSLNLTASALNVWEKLLYAWWTQRYNDRHWAPMFSAAFAWIQDNKPDRNKNASCQHVCQKILIWYVQFGKTFDSKPDGRFSPIRSDPILFQSCLSSFCWQHRRPEVQLLLLFMYSVFSIVDAKRRITAPCRSKVQLTSSHTASFSSGVSRKLEISVKKSIKTLHSDQRLGVGILNLAPAS